jgi:hypothetical protein
MGKYLDSLAAMDGFEGIDHRLDVLGTCSECRERAGAVPALAAFPDDG